MNKLFTLIAGLLVFTSVSAFALPFDIQGEYRLDYGELLVPGLVSVDEVNYAHQVSFKRPFDLKPTLNIVLIPFIVGEMYSLDLGDDLLLTTISAGVEVALNDNFSIGAKRSILDYESKVDKETYDSLFLKVNF